MIVCLKGKHLMGAGKEGGEGREPKQAHLPSPNPHEHRTESWQSPEVPMQPFHHAEMANPNGGVPPESRTNQRRTGKSKPRQTAKHAVNCNV